MRSLVMPYKLGTVEGCTHKGDHKDNDSMNIRECVRILSKVNDVSKEHIIASYQFLLKWVMSNHSNHFSPIEVNTDFLLSLV